MRKMKNNYTKKIFAHSLRELLKENNIDNIQVKEICAHCNLSKKTFYYHFQDKYDLAFYLYNSLLTDVLSDVLDSDYQQDFSAGNPVLNEMDPQSVTVIQTICQLWNFTCKDFSRNLSWSEDINSPKTSWYNGAISGRKAILKNRLEKEGKTLPENMIDLAASILCTTSLHYYDLWRKEQNITPTEESALELININNKLIDFFISLAT